jgi:AcrR family transcriptional regulator
MTKRLEPRKTPRQVRAVHTRERLLAGAARVFAEHGYAAGTTNRIADEAGHSIGSLYQYFPNKDAILAELVTRHAEEGLSMVRRQLAEGPLPESLHEKLRLFVRVVIDLHREDPRLHRVLFEEAPRPPELLATLHEAERQITALAKDLLAAEPQVRVRDRSMAARLVVGAVESLVHRFISSGSLDDTDRFEDELISMLMCYLTGSRASIA